MFQFFVDTTVMSSTLKLYLPAGTVHSPLLACLGSLKLLLYLTPCLLLFLQLLLRSKLYDSSVRV